MLALPMNCFMIVRRQSMDRTPFERCSRSWLNSKNKRLALELLTVSRKNILDKPLRKTVEGESVHGMMCGAHHSPKPFAEPDGFLGERLLWRLAFLKFRRRGRSGVLQAGPVVRCGA